jgi:hypothetical protein
MQLIDVRGTKLVGVDAKGNRLGEDHPRAKLSNEEVELIRELANPSDGAASMPQRLIAEKFEISRGTVADIVTFRRRASYPVGWRRVRVQINGRELVGNFSSVAKFVVDHDSADND